MKINDKNHRTWIAARLGIDPSRLERAVYLQMHGITAEQDLVSYHGDSGVRSLAVLVLELASELATAESQGADRFAEIEKRLLALEGKR